MAKVKQNKQVKSLKKSFQSPFSIYWTKNNYVLFGVAVVLIIVGFFAMSIGPWDSTASLVAAPVILFIAYVILLPLSIMFRGKNNSKESDVVKVDSGKS